MKKPGEQMAGQDVELSLTRQAAEDMPPYQRLLGDAMRGSAELFTREGAASRPNGKWWTGSWAT